MKCIGCGKDGAIIALIEAFPCRHCEGEIHLEYNVCRECGQSWKTVDGEFISKTMLFDMGLGEAYFEESDMKEEKTPCMNDFIHKCLKCNTICCEIESNPSLYRCPACGFEWEVLKND